MTLGQYLARHELTEGAFAETINVSRETVRRYVAGKRIPTKDVMARIALATGCAVTANDFFGIEVAA